MEAIVRLISHIPQIKIRKANIQSAEREDILKQLRETKKQLDAVRSCFDLETNFDLIDSYIMEMDSLEKRYSYWLKEAKNARIAAF